MKKLDKVIRKNGFVYELMKRNKYVAIYKQEDTGYEVFLIRVGKAENIKGREYPEREVFPFNEDFGEFAWSYRKYEQALEKYKYLNKHLRYFKSQKLAVGRKYVRG